MRRRRAALWTAALASLCAGTAGAMEFGLDLRTANLQFPWNGLAPTAGSAAYPSYNYFWGGSVWAVLPLGEDAALRLTYEIDPVLRNMASGLVLFERGAARIAVGPFVGLLNGPTTGISGGLSTTIRFQWPGLAYVSARSDGGLALGLITAAAEPQAQAELAAGFYVRNAIVSGIVSGKRFAETDADGKLVSDSLSRYAITVDIFKKNVPYTLLAQAAYQVRTKYFAASDTTETVGSLILGTRFSMMVGGGYTAITDLSTAVFAFGLEDLAGRSPNKNDTIFAVSIGVAADTEYIARELATKKADEEKALKEIFEEAAASANQPKPPKAGSTPTTSTTTPAATPSTGTPAPAAPKKP